MDDKFVFFDLGNVLVHFDHDIAVRNVARLVDRQPAQVKQAIFTCGLQDRLETGLISSQEFAENLKQSLDTQVEVQPLLEAISAIFHPNDAIVHILQQLKTAGIPMAVLSNSCEPHWLWLMRQNWAVVEGWFDFHVLSYEARSMKPDHGIYETSERMSNRRPAQLFFTDDRADNVATAQARGWTAHQFTDVGHLARNLGDWLGIELHGDRASAGSESNS